MMSVLVKGMKMPKNCFSCQLKEAGFCNLTNELVNELVVGIYRNSDCPLVELPEKHGRLIDADAFAEFIEDAIKSQRYKYVTVDGTLTVADVLTAVIDDLKGNIIVKYESNPTVIEAEGEE